MDNKRIVLENDNLIVEIASCGAELKRIYGKKNNLEYLWKGDKAGFWQRSAPLLFPFVGRFQDGIYTYKGERYSIACHGFAKDSSFFLADCSSVKAVLELKSDSETKKAYPFDFLLVVSYILDESCLKEVVEVENRSNCTMLFKIGFHPAFNVPLQDNLSFEDYEIDFKDANCIKRRKISKRGLETGDDFVPVEIDGNILHLEHNIFSNEALVLSNTGGSAKLFSGKSNHYVSLEYNTFWCSLWQEPRPDTPFVAIEPWYNLPGKDSVIEDLEQIKDVETLQKGEKKSFELTFNFG